MIGATGFIAVAAIAGYGMSAQAAETSLQMASLVLALIVVATAAVGGRLLSLLLPVTAGFIGSFGLWFPWAYEQFAGLMLPLLGESNPFADRMVLPIAVFAGGFVSAALLFALTRSSAVLGQTLLVSALAGISPLVPMAPAWVLGLTMLVWQAAVIAALCGWAIEAGTDRYMSTCWHCGVDIRRYGSIERCPRCRRRLQSLYDAERVDDPYSVVSRAGAGRPRAGAAASGTHARSAQVEDAAARPEQRASRTEAGRAGPAGSKNSRSRGSRSQGKQRRGQEQGNKAEGGKGRSSGSKPRSAGGQRKPASRAGGRSPAATPEPRFGAMPPVPQPRPRPVAPPKPAPLAEESPAPVPSPFSRFGKKSRSEGEGDDGASVARPGPFSRFGRQAPAAASDEAGAAPAQPRVDPSPAAATHKREADAGGDQPARETPGAAPHTPAARPPASAEPLAEAPAARAGAQRVSASDACAPEGTARLGARGSQPRRSSEKPLSPPRRIMTPDPLDDLPFSDAPLADNAPSLRATQEEPASHGGSASDSAPSGGDRSSGSAPRRAGSDLDDLLAELSRPLPEFPSLDADRSDASPEQDTGRGRSEAA